MKEKLIFYFLPVLFCSIFISCASLQKDIVMSTDGFVENEDVDLLEERYITFDAKSILNGKFNPENLEYAELDVLEKDIANAIVASGMNKIIDSRLYALEGLACLIQGKKQKAKSLYVKSLAENKGDSYTMILGFRLGELQSLEDENVVSGSNQSNLLVLEQGLSHYSKGEYADCVAKLDSAFINLPPFYRTAYNEIRSNAWELRNNSVVTDNKTILAILNKNQITSGEMAFITQETSELFITLNAGKKYNEIELFNRLKKAGYFSSEEKKNNLVVRSKAANYLWNLYCNKKKIEDQKNKYSTFYREKVGQSPIPDVDLESEYFDAILGVVEQEIMSLPDGINFEPDEKVGASEFNSWLEKIR